MFSSILKQGKKSPAASTNKSHTFPEKGFKDIPEQEMSTYTSLCSQNTGPSLRCLRVIVCQHTFNPPPQMEYCSNALSWIVDTLAQGSTFKPPRPPPTLRGIAKSEHTFIRNRKTVCMLEFHRFHSLSSINSAVFTSKYLS